MNDDFGSLRREYRQRGLAESEAGDDPIALFRVWLDDAVDAGVAEPNAVVLATASADGRPSARAVLLKQLDHAGFVFFTQATSRKGRELAVNPSASLCFLWAELERQIRIEGSVEPAEPAVADAYFASRPRASQLSAWASPQSEAVSDRHELERRLAEVARRFDGAEVPRPPTWIGYRLAPQAIEFWQGREGRLHDRLHYRLRADGSWERRRLGP